MTRVIVRPTLPRLAANAASQTAIAARASLPFVAWSFVAVTLGLLVGLMAVILPPVAVFAVIGGVGLVLLWALPDLRVVPDRLVRRLLFLALIVDLCVPTYYTIQVSALPWISARRIVIFPLILVFALAFSGSSRARSRMAAVIKDNPIVALCAVGYIFMGFVSVFTSVHPPSSMTGVINALLTWYVPLMAILYVVRSEDDVHTVIRLLAFCAIFISAAGAIEFALQKNVFVAIMPHQLVDQLASDNPTFERMITVSQFRNGLYRALSTYNVALSFGEFEAMMLPVGYYFIVHSVNGRDRLLGIVLTFACIVGLFCSGSRGGYMAAMVATGAFSLLFCIRLMLSNARSLAPAVLGIVALAGFMAFLAAIAVSTRLRNVFTGGGEGQLSNDSRREQWEMGIPHIVSNPFTGHGFDLGGVVLGYHMETGLGTIDSFALSTLLETGVPGFLLFFGMVFVAVFSGTWQYLANLTRSGALAGTLGCSLLGFGLYRFALSQEENFTLLYVMVGLIMFLNHNCKIARKQRTSVRPA